MIQDMHERLKKANERRNCGADEEIASLRAELSAKDAEIERLKAILADALEWGMTSKHFDAGRSLKNGEDARAAISRAEQAKPETETCAWTVSENGVWIQHGCTGAQMLKGHLFIRPETCPYCKKKLIIEQAGKAEGRQG